MNDVNMDKKYYSLTEILTVISIIGVCYALIYKFSFFYHLGLPWYITTISPLSVIISSLLFIILSFLGFSLGVIIHRLAKYFSKKHNVIYLDFIPILFFLFLSIITVPFFSLFDFSLINKYIDIYNLNMFFLMILTGSMTSINHYTVQTFNEQNSIQRPIVVALGICTVLLVAYAYGMMEATKIYKNKSENLSEVLLENDAAKWFLVDYMGDKVLIMKESNERVFKIVEYKDIKQIKVDDKKLNTTLGIK